MAVDIKRKTIFASEVSNEEVNDGMMLKNLVVNASCGCNHVGGLAIPGMYDGNKNFRSIKKSC